MLGNGKYLVIFNKFDLSGKLIAKIKVGEFTISNNQVTNVDGVAAGVIRIGPFTEVTKHRILHGLNNGYYETKRDYSFAPTPMKKSDKYGKTLNKMKNAIEHGAKNVKLNRDYNVPGLAGYSIDGSTIYIDKRVPNHTGNIETDQFLLVHEATEKALMDKLGFGYPHAHDLALHAEKRAVERAGYSWAVYDKFMQHWIKEIGEDVSKELRPPDLDPDKVKHHRTIKEILKKTEI